MHSSFISRCISSFNVVQFLRLCWHLFAYIYKMEGLLISFLIVVHRMPCWLGMTFLCDSYECTFSTKCPSRLPSCHVRQVQSSSTVFELLLVRGYVNPFASGIEPHGLVCVDRCKIQRGGHHGPYEPVLSVILSYRSASEPRVVQETIPHRNCK